MDAKSHATGDPGWKYGAFGDSGSIPRHSFPGYLSSEASTLTTLPWNSNNLRSSSSNFSSKDIAPSRPGGYSADDYLGRGVLPEPDIGGFTAGASTKNYSSPLKDANLFRQRHDVFPGASHISND